MNNTRRGFTLIELMIVIAIIAILAAILIPNFLHARAESITSACEGNEKQIATAEEEYAVDNSGAYANKLGAGGLTTPYLGVVITDPVHAGNAYTISVPGTLNAQDSYEISDSGGHDTTTTGRLTTITGAACGLTCASVIYAQASGIHGH